MPGLRIRAYINEDFNRMLLEELAKRVG